jgi:hypothetical protein
MAKSVTETMEELRGELRLMKERIERMRTDGSQSLILDLERWMVEAEKVLSRWDGAGEP